MEHRWGHRSPVGLKVLLLGCPGAIGFGLLQDVSISGAYVRTNLRLPLLSYVTLGMNAHPTGQSESCGIPAHVVRCDGLGLGLEWEEFAPQAITQLLSGAPAHKEPIPLAVPDRVSALPGLASSQAG